MEKIKTEDSLLGLFRVSEECPLSVFSPRFPGKKRSAGKRSKQVPKSRKVSEHYWGWRKSRASSRSMIFLHSLDQDDNFWHESVREERVTSNGLFLHILRHCSVL
jgi:hypothetical protein